MLQNPTVIIITGPCGVGKTTISDILAKELDVSLIRGDRVKDVLYPKISDISQFPDKLQAVKAAIFDQAKEQFEKGQSVLIDYVMLGSEYIQAYQQEFGANLFIKVLYLVQGVAFSRDEQRQCWTSGQTIIRFLYEKFKIFEDLIGKDNYLDSTNQTPEETAHILLQKILTHDHA